MSQDNIEEILRRYKTVAIVGLSRDSSKDSYRVAEYLKEHGFRIIPVNPFVEEVLGEKSYRSLLEMPLELQKVVEIIDIFRPVTETTTVVNQAVSLRQSHGAPHVIWMQIGIANQQAAETARKAGMTVIMDRCMMREHRKVVEEK